MHISVERLGSLADLRRASHNLGERLVGLAWFDESR